MEGGGFLEAVDINSLVSGGVVRGISDLLSGKTEADQGGSQKLAADAASAAAFEVLHGLVPTARIKSKGGKKKTPPTALKKKKREARSKPAVSAIENAPASARLFLETPATLNKATFFDVDEVLAKVGVPDNVDEVYFSYFKLPDAYLRRADRAARCTNTITGFARSRGTGTHVEEGSGCTRGYEYTWRDCLRSFGHQSWRPRASKLGDAALSERGALDHDQYNDHSRTWSTAIVGAGAATANICIRGTLLQCSACSGCFCLLAFAAELSVSH